METKRGPGRPKLSKGNSSWAPASVTDVTNKDPNFRYRWLRKDSDNLYKKEQEGWESVSAVTSDQASPQESNRISDGKNITSVYEKHDTILGRIPVETALERDAYYNAESERRVAGLTAHIKKDLAKEGASAHGDITISSRKGA